MTRGRVALALWILGCSVPPAVTAPAELELERICPSDVSYAERFGSCWLGRLPVRACPAAVHPELVGLWGIDQRPDTWEPLDQPYFDPVILYDGCCVTVEYMPRVSIDSFQEQFDRGHSGAINEGLAHRTRAAWEGGDLLRTVSRRGTLVVARREATEGDQARLVEVRPGHPDVPLVRFGPSHCVNIDVRNMLCARGVLGYDETDVEPGWVLAGDACSDEGG